MERPCRRGRGLEDFSPERRQKKSVYLPGHTWCAIQSVRYFELYHIHSCLSGGLLRDSEYISGLVLLPSFIPPDQQQRLVHWALCDQARAPNETNLDTHYVLPTEGLWNQYIRVRNGEIDDTKVTPHTYSQSNLDDASSQYSQQELSGPRKLISNEAASIDNYASLAQTPKPPALPSQSLRPVPISHLIHKLRWANIGWFYHWGTKQYDFTRGPGEISEEIRGVCKSAVESIPWDVVFGSDDEADWGEGGQDWKDWHETYGEPIV